MQNSGDVLLTFNAKELRGSRLRCLIMTSLPEAQIAAILTRLASPIASVNAQSHCFAPRGFLHPEEPKLGEHDSFLTPEEREEVTNWWLARRQRANTPNWDVVSQCEIESKRGLILVEAKAHMKEAKPE